SILMHVLGQDPVMVSARGSTCVQAGVHDVCYMEIQFSGGTSANVHVSWLHPDKVRRLTLVGDRRMAVFDDISDTTKLRIYDHGVEYAVTDNYGEFELASRRGEIVIPYIAWREPLRLECEHFLDCVRCGNRPLSDGEQGMAVVATLEAADRSLRSGGVRVPVKMPALPVIGQKAVHRNGKSPHHNGSNASIRLVLAGGHGRGDSRPWPVRRGAPGPGRRAGGGPRLMRGPGAGRPAAHRAAGHGCTGPGRPPPALDKRSQLRRAGCGKRGVAGYPVAAGGRQLGRGQASAAGRP